MVRLFSIIGSAVAGLLVGGGFLFASELVQETPQPVRTDASLSVRTVVSGVVPHHLVAESLIKDFWQTVASEQPSIVVIVSPDHWGVARSPFVSTDQPQLADVPIAAHEVDLLTAQLGNEALSFDQELLTHEHGITNLLPFFRDALPSAKLVPIAITANTNTSQLDDVVSMLATWTGKNLAVVASSDFSHYLPSSAAELHDATSISALQSFSFDRFPELEVDCWQCLYVSAKFAQMKGLKQPHLLGHTNSAILGKAGLTAEETTSYVTLLYEKGDAKIAPPVTLLAVGDLMLGRYVETLRNRNGDDYLFANARQFLRGVDLLIGNLEGPIVRNHRQTPNDSLMFSFPQSTAPFLRKEGFDFLSLANNHSLNRGVDGYEETVELLSEVGIGTFGHEQKVREAPVTVVDQGGAPLMIIGLNAARSSFPKDEAIDLIQNKSQEHDRFVVVSIHWGSEYQTTSNALQQGLAHALIDAGADLILGSHPHVVQEVEQYKNRLIVYSLGNFIFDQYFSKDTQTMLALGMELSETNVTYRLFPFVSSYSQPSLMKRLEALPWLENMAKRSRGFLPGDVEKGILTMPRM